MSNSKIDFINDLLSSKKLKIEEKNRILDLTKSELKSFDFENEEIKKRIDAIEDKIKTLEGETNESILLGIAEDNKENNLTIYKNPKDLRDFLIEYNQNQVLKYTCHEIDNPDSLKNILNECKIENYDFEKHLSLIHREYKKLSFKYKDKVLKNVTGLISTYLGTYNSKEGWSHQINMGWNNQELKDWALNNLHKIPNPSIEFQIERFRFRTIELKNGDTISDFTQLVIYFKNLFHFKGTNLLRKHINDFVFLKYSDENKFHIEYDSDFSDTIELFTYSEPLLQAVGRILDMSKKYHENELLKVKLFFGYDENNFKEFKVVILNSEKFEKTFDAFSSRVGDDFSNLIKYQINGLCNFYLKAHFEDKKSVGLVNVWDGEPIEFKKFDRDIEGVEFILKMY